MGVSFKISKKGKRYRPQPSAAAEEGSVPGDSSNEGSGVGVPTSKGEDATAKTVNGVTGISVSSTCPRGFVLRDQEVSFILNLFQMGYLIGKTTEMQDFQPLLQDPKTMRPYDRASENLFSAIESGRVPGDILDDIPCKYVDGSLVCEVRDYRKCMFEKGTHTSTADALPVINRVLLRMSLENVVKDIPSIAKDSWTYRDLLEVESRILKALQPRLYLDPTPMLDRVCDDPTYLKQNLGIGRKKRSRQASDVTVAFNNQVHEKKVCIDSCNEEGQRIVLGHAVMQQIHENPVAQHVSGRNQPLRLDNLAEETAKPTVKSPAQVNAQPAISYSTVVHDCGLESPANFPGVFGSVSPPPNLMDSHTVRNALMFGNKENMDAPLTSMEGIKRIEQTLLGRGSTRQQQVGPGKDWRNQLLHPQVDINGVHYIANAQRYPAQVINTVTNQEIETSSYVNRQEMKFAAKGDPQTDIEKRDLLEVKRSKSMLHALATENTSYEQQQSRFQHLEQQSSMRNHILSPAQWHHARQLAGKDTRKDDTVLRRKSEHSSEPVSLKAGKNSSGLVGCQLSAVATTSRLGLLKDKATTSSYVTVGVPSVTSNPKDSVQRQHQVSAAAKRKLSSITRIEVRNGIGPPAGISDNNATPNANSLLIGNGATQDKVVLERFAQIEKANQRYQLSHKKNKVDYFPKRKPVSCSSQHISLCLSNSLNTEDFIDPPKPLSRSLTGGTANTCKVRLMTFSHTRRISKVVPSHCHNIMIEKPNGTVEMQYGDANDSYCPDIQNCLLVLPTTHHADILAAQFSVLMERDRYQRIQDQTNSLADFIGAASSSQVTIPRIPLDNNAVSGVLKKEIDLGQQAYVPCLATNSAIGSQDYLHNFSANARMLAFGSGSQVLLKTQGDLLGTATFSRTQVDQLQLLPLPPQQQYQQKFQLERSLQSPQQQKNAHQLLPGNSPSQILGQSTTQMGTNSMINNTHLQLQLLQQHNQLSGKMMEIGATRGMSSTVGGTGSLSNVMGMEAAGTISTSTVPMSSLASINPSQINLGTSSSFGTAFRPGSMYMTQCAAMSCKLRMVENQNRSAMYSSHSELSGPTGNNRRTPPKSAGHPMLGHPLNLANMSSLQHNASSVMGPPKTPGANLYLNQQQQLKLQQQLHLKQLPQQQQEHQLKQQQLQLQKQQISSPLQQEQVGSPPVVGSSSSMVMQLQQISQQIVMSPQQLNSGAPQQINNISNAGDGSSSPRLSSQVHESVKCQLKVANNTLINN